MNESKLTTEYLGLTNSWELDRGYEEKGWEQEVHLGTYGISYDT